MKTAKSIIVVLFVLLTAQIASAYYCPSTGRWLSRDPIGETGFQALQTTTIAPRIGSSTSSQTARWIQRDSIPRNNEPNIYEFVGNNPIIAFDGLGLCSCGPDITGTLVRTLLNVDRQFNDSSTDQKKVCSQFLSAGGWDMPLLLGNIKSPCGSSGTCSQTVTFSGTCYRGSEVNYALFGKMCSLCDISQPSMDAIIIGWKLWEKPGPYDGQLHGALAWANAGFIGLGGIGPRSPYSDRTYCSPCSTPFQDVIFNWHAGGMSGTK